MMVNLKKFVTATLFSSLMGTTSGFAKGDSELIVPPELQGRKVRIRLNVTKEEEAQQKALQAEKLAEEKRIRQAAVQEERAQQEALVAQKLIEEEKARQVAAQKRIEEEQARLAAAAKRQAEEQDLLRKTRLEEVNRMRTQPKPKRSKGLFGKLEHSLQHEQEREKNYRIFGIRDINRHILKAIDKGILKI
jgi:hypothetical protein